jgi:hypothetical protein
MVRELADWDPARAACVVRWPLREALLGYVAILRAEALKAYRFETLLWAMLAPHAKKKTSPPKIPDLLKG